MKAEFWLERWRNNEIGFHQQEINTHLQEFWGQLELSVNSWVLVPLCGKTRDMLWLRAQGHRVLGVEISPIAVHDFFAENDLQPQTLRQGDFESYATDGLVVLCGDFFKLRSKDLQQVTGIYDRASLVALPSHMRIRYAQHMKSILPHDGAILLVTMEYPQAEMQGPPFAVTEEEVRHLYGDCYHISLLFTADILEENPRFQERGLTQLEEKVFHLTST